MEGALGGAALGPLCDPTPTPHPFPLMTRDEIWVPSVHDSVSSHRASELGQRTHLGGQGAEAEATISMRSLFKPTWDWKGQCAVREK